MNHKFVSLFFFVNLLLTSCNKIESPKADLILINGDFITLEDSLQNARALAIKADTILAIGSLEELKSFIGPNTDTLDLQGNIAYPGFIDAHSHFLGIGETKKILWLGKAKSWNEIVLMVGEAVKNTPKGTWILGRGWHQEKWQFQTGKTVEGFPVHDSLSALSPEHPVLLEHASGHASFANLEAMRRAGIQRETPNPEGGMILRDEKGLPTGFFQETAAELLESAYRATRLQMTEEEKEKEFEELVQLATEECLSKGVTSFHDAGVGESVLKGYRKLSKENRLDVRLWVMISGRENNLEEKLKQYKTIDPTQKFLTIRGIKEYMDGALGSRGAWLLSPYSDLPDAIGQNVRSLDSIKYSAQLAKKYGFQLCTHAIGDRANREALNIYEEVLNGDRSSRWRIEHAQHLSNEDIPRFAKLGVIASMQGIHCTSDAPFVLKRLAIARATEGAYAWKKLIKSGAVVTNGTDAPVEDVSPLACFYSSVTRKMSDGTPFFAEESMSRIEALQSYTILAAYSGHEEHVKGSLKVGKYADITILDTNLLTASEEALKSAKVLYTIVGGKIKYQRKN
ncbi:MAG: amidohydrolase [Chloroherpetonaceae bacterium]|nr:amidohydrolase [Chloroherpetonaceae bacterium]